MPDPTESNENFLQRVLDDHGGILPASWIEEGDDDDESLEDDDDDFPLAPMTPQMVRVYQIIEDMKAMREKFVSRIEPKNFQAENQTDFPETL